jgi:hypothetical protein
MKRIKVGFGVLALAIFISWLSFGTANAQAPGFNIWEGRWLKINTNFKGYERNMAGLPDWFTVNDRFTLYLNIVSWNNPDFSAVFWYYDQDSARWQDVPVTLNYLHGTPLDFLIWVLNDQGQDPFPADNTERLTFAARLSGKLMRGTTDLQTASFKCLGGYFIEIAPDDPDGAIYAASGVTMTGTLVPLNFCDSARNSLLPPCL